MKTIFFTGYLLIISFFPDSIFGQGIEGELTKNQFRIDLLLPGFAFERSITKNMSLVIGTHMGITSVDRANGDKNKTIGIHTISLQYRYYLNLQKRLSKGKSTLTNSGFYTGILTEKAIFYGQDKSTLFSKAGVVSGFQHTFHNGFNINVAGGAGYTDGIDYRAKIRPFINLSFGIVLGAKKKYRQPALSTQ